MSAPGHPDPPLPPGCTARGYAAFVACSLLTHGLLAFG